MGRELKRVAMDFNCPIGATWRGYINPHYTAQECTACGGSGYSPRARELKDLWYGYTPFDPHNTGSHPFLPTDEAVLELAKRNLFSDPEFYGTSMEACLREARRLADLFNGRWMHHLAQDDVDTLVAAGRLYDFTHTWTPGECWNPKDPPYHPTATEVNRWSLGGIGHDCVNCHVVIEGRCKREGVDTTCSACHGHGDIWPSEEAKQRYEAWEKTEPPAGDGYQIWQNVSEGGPVSPVFATPEDLAAWMVANDDSVTKNTTYEQWMAFICGQGWAPSFVIQDDTFMAGVQAVA